MTPRAIGLKEDMQQDVRYEFDAVLSIDKDTHNVEVVKDRVGYLEIRETSSTPESPLTVEDGKVLARLVNEGVSLEELANRKLETLRRFIANEKAHNSSKISLIESRLGLQLTSDVINAFSYDELTKIVKYLKK
jgi:hypothetical protein